MTDEYHIVDCATCKAKVQGIERGVVWTCNDGADSAFIFLECPLCHGPSVVISDRFQTGIDSHEWDRGTRLWPAVTDLALAESVPMGIGKDLVDARKCIDAGVYSAAAVMCGRALEGIAREKTGERNLSKGLQKLKETGIIDERLYTWSELLRKQRNLGAHSSEEQITKDNAQDVYDFAVAICEYIYVLNEKYSAFIKRNEQKQAVTKTD